MRGKTKDDTLAPVVDALDAISAEWLRECHPKLADSIESAVGSGATPEQIKWRVLHHTQRSELALRCWQAARYWESIED